MLVVDLFGQDLPARQISLKTGISYPTILKAIETLRMAIITNSADSSKWLDYIYFQSEVLEQAQSLPKQVDAFGIVKINREIKIHILKGLTLESLAKHHPKILGKSSIFYTNEFYPYETILFHDMKNDGIIPEKKDPEDVDQARKESEFWRFAKSKIIKHRGISKQKLPQYLKEIEFRFNCMGNDIFEPLCRYLVSFIPDHC